MAPATTTPSLPLEEPVLLWLIAALAAVAVGGTTAGPPAVVAVAVPAAALVLRAPYPARALVVAALLPLSSPHTTAAWLWIATAGALALAVALTAHAAIALAQRPSASELQRHLARFRRLEERGDVLVVRPTSDAAAVRLSRHLRATDSAALTRLDGRIELQAVVDRRNLQRPALEHRLSGIAREELEIGWARFPEDGLTLDVLLEQARHAYTTPAVARCGAVFSPRKPTTEGSHA